MKKHNCTFNCKRFKGCIIVIWAQMLFATWVILKSQIAAVTQASSLLFLFISMYLQLIIIQDYLYMKCNTKNEKLRRNLRIIEPLLPERFKKNDA